MSGTKRAAAKFTAAFLSDNILPLLHLFESTNSDLSSTHVENAKKSIHKHYWGLRQQNVHSN